MGTTDKQWAFITPAEMQNSPTACAIGICQGSSPKMTAEVMNNNLALEVETKEGTIEASWQLIDLSDLGGDVVKEMW